MAKVTMGRAYLLLGPYLDISNYTDIKGQIIINSHYYPGHPSSESLQTNNEIKNNPQNIIGIGFNLPIKNNRFCVELKSEYGFTDVIHSPNMRPFITSLSIIYQLNKNGW